MSNQSIYTRKSVRLVRCLKRCGSLLTLGGWRVRELACADERPPFSTIIANCLTPLIARFWGQHGAHLGPTGPRWAPCWPHEPCYLGLDWPYIQTYLFLLLQLCTYLLKPAHNGSNFACDICNTFSSINVLLSWFNFQLRLFPTI